MLSFFYQSASSEMLQTSSQQKQKNFANRKQNSSPDVMRKSELEMKEILKAFTLLQEARCSQENSIY